MGNLVKIVVALALFLGVSAVVAANFSRAPDFLHFKWKLNREAPHDVKLETASKGSIVHTIEAPGEVEAEIEVEISSQVVGRINRLPVREGDTVKKGDLLAQIDDVDFRAQVRSADARTQRIRSMLDRTEADLSKAQRDVERNKKLFDRGALGAQEMADSETMLAKEKANLAAAKAELLDAEATLAKAKEDLADTTILAPVEGVVSRLDAEEGEVVVMGTMNNPGTVMMTVSDMGSMIVRCRVDETDVHLVKPGQNAVIHLQYDEDLDVVGKVKRITPKGSKGQTGGRQAVAAATGSVNDISTFETLISIENPPKEVRLGMTANVEIQVDKRDETLIVPSQSVLHRQLKDLPAHLVEAINRKAPVYTSIRDPLRRYHQIVFVAVNGFARAHLVETGISDESRVEILSGLEDGDRVVSGPYRVFEKLKDGSPVKAMAEQSGGPTP